MTQQEQEELDNGILKNAKRSRKEFGCLKRKVGVISQEIQRLIRILSEVESPDLRVELERGESEGRIFVRYYGTNRKQDDSVDWPSRDELIELVSKHNQARQLYWKNEKLLKKTLGPDP